MNQIKLIACVVLLVGAPRQVQAEMVTLEFSGIITTNTDFNSPVQFGVGTAFSGYVTYDVDNAELVTFQETNPGNTSGFAISDSGCLSYVNGVCVDSRGSDSPVVIDYEFNWAGGTVKPWSYSLDFQDSSRRVNLFDVPPAPITGEGWSVRRNQFRSEIVGDLDNYDYTRVLSKRSLTVGAYSNDDALLPGPIDDFTQGFSPEVLFLNGRSTIDLTDYVSVEVVSARGESTTVYSAGSYKLGGELTGASFRLVPEPSSILMCSFSMTLVVGRRRQRRRNCTKSINSTKHQCQNHWQSVESPGPVATFKPPSQTVSPEPSIAGLHMTRCQTTRPS